MLIYHHEHMQSGSQLEPDQGAVRKSFPVGEGSRHLADRVTGGCSDETTRTYRNNVPQCVHVSLHSFTQLYLSDMPGVLFSQTVR